MRGKDKTKAFGIATLVVAIGLLSFAFSGAHLESAEAKANPPAIQESLYEPGHETEPLEVTEAELFEGIPSEEILEPGDIALDSLNDIIPEPTVYWPSTGSPSRERCRQSCDNQYYNTLIPQCKRIRTGRSRAICYGTANIRYGACLARC